MGELPLELNSFPQKTRSYPQVKNSLPPPQISIILPVFNRETLLPETIKSLLEQTFQNFELIIVNDGSNDSTVGILQSYTKLYPQKITIINQKNRGVSAARNAGVTRAKGQYIALIDSDDLWITTKLDKQVAYMEQQNIAISQTGEAWSRNGKMVNPMKKHTKHSGKIFYDSLELCLVSPSATVIKKEVFEQIGLFDEDLPVCEDYDLWLRILVHYPIYLMPEKLIIKRGGHSDQLSRKYWGMDRFRIKSMRNLLRSHSATLNQFKKNALYWWIAEKSRILALGGWKRKKFLFWAKYKFLQVYYTKKWNSQ